MRLARDSVLSSALVLALEGRISMIRKCGAGQRMGIVSAIILPLTFLAAFASVLLILAAIK